MVHKRGTELGLDSSQGEDVSMPTYLQRTGHRYVFRQAVPASLREVIGKREVKKSLGSDYREAVSKGKILAVQVEQQFEAAREKIARKTQRLERMKISLKVISEITPALLSQFRSRWLSIVDVSDWQRRANQFESVGQDEIAENHASLVPELKQALATGNVDAFIPVMHQTLYLMGFELAPELHESSDERRLALELVRGALEGAKVIAARDSGDDPVIVLPAEPLVRTDPTLSARATDEMMLSGLISKFLEDWSGGKPMLQKLRQGLELFLELLGDKPIGALRQSHLNEFFNLIQRLPPRWSDECRKRKLSVGELAKLDHPRTIGQKTFDDGYLAAFRIFLKEAKRSYQDVGFPTTLTTEGVRFTGTRMAGENKQRAFKPSELKRLFEGPELREYALDVQSLHKFWLPVIGVYTGARVNEICQINPQVDIIVREGVLCLELTVETESGEGVEKTIKTKVNRSVPIHRNLLALGLADYLSELKHRGATRLFPAWPTLNGKASPAAAKWFSRFLDQLGMHGQKNEEGKALRGSHAFRFTVLTYGKLAKVNLRCITGHAEPDANQTAQGYEDESILTPIKQKQVLLDTLDYGLTIPRPVVLN
jgi:integrase